ncbi:Inner membrane transport protein YdhP [Saezia sanguinis]|uniref:Inner membrane transport protein YdhP n=1 Tax=Saezia sanguinis TaxID=1965230 RepID=A0A433SBA9_9BURK|nr:MFS transporter [Saezia sanguinis]RUS65979.1 Inner membrane transport protein YdhP [Saezia sanguinis]
MTDSTNQAKNRLLIPILTLGVFGILNTEMGVVGIIPIIARQFDISVPDAGWMVSLFALVIAFAAPVVPLFFSKMNRKTAMTLALSVFVISNIVSIFAQSYTVQLVFRAIPALFHPVYITIAFTTAAASVSKQDAPKAVAKLFIGVSAGMVLGVPITSFIADEWGFSTAMVFFTAVNVMVLAATLLFVPSMPAGNKLTYGEQLGVLKKMILWLSVTAAILMNAVMFGFYSYLSDYLQSVTLLPFKIISLLLFVYGMANIIGNVFAGRLLARAPSPTLMTMPVLLLALYALLFVMGKSAFAVTAILLPLGIAVGIANNGNQYMVSTAAPEAPEFTNGLFLTAANLGTTLGTFVCGLFISGWGAQYAILSAMLFAALGIIGIALRTYLYKPKGPSENYATPTLAST